MILDEPLFLCGGPGRHPKSWTPQSPATEFCIKQNLKSESEVARDGSGSILRTNVLLGLKWLV